LLIHDYAGSSAAIALRTFVLKVQPPRLTTTTLPEAPGSMLVQAVSWLLKEEAERGGGSDGNSPTAAPMVVPPLAG